MLAWVRGERGGGDSAAGSVSVSWCPGHIMGPIITLLPLLLRCSEISDRHLMIQTNILFQLTSRRKDPVQEIQPRCDYRTGLCCSSKAEHRNIQLPWLPRAKLLQWQPDRGPVWLLQWGEGQGAIPAPHWIPTELSIWGHLRTLSKAPDISVIIIPTLIWLW